MEELNREIPYGFCKCGCGRQTTIAKQSETRDGLIKGEPKNYILGHNSVGENNPSWKGGRMISCGYIRLNNRNHNMMTPKILQ